MTDPATVTVVGNGITAIEPDTLSITIGVTVTAATPSAALQEASEAMHAVRAAVLAEGIAETDVQTSRVSVQQDWDHSRGSGGPAGYTADIGMHLATSSTERVGRLLESAVTAGGDAARVHGVGWTISDPASAAESARTAAFADARSRAEHYATLAGRGLGAVSRVDEGSGFERGSPYRTVALAASAGEMELDRGEVAVRANVVVTWELV
jgi:uncharacterized protein